MKKNKIFNKTIYSVLLISLFLGNSIGTARALFGGGPKVPSIGEVLDTVEYRYGFDKDILRRAQVKADYPQAEVFFDKTNPKEGEKVTATAMPKYFKNTNQQLYYTWFLFREGDDLDDEDVMEEAKIRAMGLVARGDFDPYVFETDYSSGSSDEDKDGYDASYGGGDGRGGRSNKLIRGIGKYEPDFFLSSKQVVDTTAITRCYRHNFGGEGLTVRAGDDLIVECEHKFPSNPVISFTDFHGNFIECKKGDFKVGDGKFTTKEEACWQLDPNNPDTDGDGFLDEADLAGLGQQQLTWDYKTGDRVGVVIEGTSLIPTNEGTSEVRVLQNTLITNCSGIANGTTCTSGGRVGLCQEGYCVAISECLFEGSPCNRNDGSLGECVEGVCAIDGRYEEGDVCTHARSPLGIYEDGICYISACTRFTENFACQTSDGKRGTCMNQLCIEALTPRSELDPYYKIAWAGLDVCDKERVEGADKRHLIKNDECEGSADYGFTYLATRKVSQEAEEILKPTLISNVYQAQVDINNLDHSDYITIKAVFNENQDIDPSFIDYEWKASIRNDNNIDQSGFEHEKLESITWLEGELAGGLGVDEIKFKGKNGNAFKNLIENSTDDLHFYISVKIGNSGKNQIATVKIPITKNAMGIEFLDRDGREICETEPYVKVCPVYPNQIVYVKPSETLSGDVSSWSLNGKNILNKSSDYAVFNPLSGLIPIPISGSNMELQTVSLKTKIPSEDETTTERLISIAEPMAKIDSTNVTNAWPIEVKDSAGTTRKSENVFGFKAGEDLSFKVEMVPNYLDLVSEGIALKWYINNQEVNQDFIEKNPNNISAIPTGQTIDFKIFSSDSSSINLTLKLIKEYTQAEKDALKNAWGIKTLKNSTFEKSIVLKKDVVGSNTIVKGNSISVFMASTFNNAPEYFIFIIKTAIVFVLFWSLLFGFNYWFNQEIKLKESND